LRGGWQGLLVLGLSGFGFCVLSEAVDEDDFVERCVWLLMEDTRHNSMSASSIPQFLTGMLEFQSCLHNGWKEFFYAAGSCA
jgi:hypothetical protein